MSEHAIFPRAVPPHRDMVDPTNLPAQTARYPVLVSDDDAGAITLIKMILARGGITAIGSSDPRDTLALCCSIPVSLVISDVMKPVMNGFDMLYKLRADPLTAAIPVLFVSAGNSRDRFETAERLGADAYLTKPFIGSDLHRLVVRLLSERGNWQAPSSIDRDTFDLLTAAQFTAPFTGSQWHGRIWPVGSFAPSARTG